MPSGPSDRPASALVAESIHPAVGEGDVDLHAVLLPVRGDRLDADARQADLPAVVEHPEAHRIPHLGVGRPLGEHVLPGRVDAPGQVNCHVSAYLSCAVQRCDMVDVVGEQRPHRVEVEPERLGVGLAVRLAVLGVLRPPAPHPRLELVAHRLAEPLVQAAHLTDRVGLHRAEVDVVEPVVGAAVAELRRARSMPTDHCSTLSSPEVPPVEVVGEAADDVGVDVGDRQQHVGGVAVGHHEAGVGEHPVEVVERTARAPGDLSRHGLVGSPHCSSFSTRRS